MPSAPECTERKISALNYFNESLTAYVSGSEKGLLPDVI